MTNAVTTFDEFELTESTTFTSSITPYLTAGTGQIVSDDNNST